MSNSGETLSPFRAEEDPQAYVLASSLGYIWDVGTLEWIKDPGGGGGGGPVTIADGADVAQGSISDAAWVAGDGTVISLLKTIAAGGAGLTDAQLRATPVPISAASLPLPATASTAALQTQPGVDIGDVTVNNAAGASAVNIQDGGNTITVDGTVAATQSGTWTVFANGTGYVIRLEEASGTITYVGQAVPTTATSAAAWSIKRLDSSSGLVVLWGGGTAAFTQIWDDRAALAYS